MVESFNVAENEEELGRWVGIAGAATSVGATISAYFWVGQCNLDPGLKAPVFKSST